MLLSGKVIFLTGGSMGIGYECALKYAEAGAKVVVITNDP
ncbi:MAG TPA: SDR family oxidoreductase, partial [Chitinophaga sp.]